MALTFGESGVTMKFRVESLFDLEEHAWLLVRRMELTSIVAAWQSGALSRDTMTDLFRRGEVLPEGRSTEEEVRLIGEEKQVVAATPGKVAGSP